MNQKSKTIIQGIIKLMIFLMVILLEYILITYSIVPNKKEIFQFSNLILLSNLLVVLFFNLLVGIIFIKIKYTITFTSLFFSIWSIANHYTLLYHGSPLFPSELSSFNAAMNVIEGYHFTIDNVVKKLMIISLFTFILVIIDYFLEEKVNIKKYLIRIPVLLLTGGALYILLFSSQAIKNRYAISWSYKEPVSNYGFLACCVEDLDKIINSIQKPADYNSKNIQKVEVDNTNTTDTYPDVIVILNETFCDLSYYTNLDMDKDVLADFYNIEGAIYGLAGTPGITGGTNNSEYELLTTNSMQIPLISAPFNYIHLNNSIVTYFNHLGYNTVGMHCGVSSTYNRKSAYAKLGFDEVYLDTSDFEYINYYGKRPWLDSDNYLDMLSHYNEESEDPQFLYILTYANHGGYTRNDESYDLVHISNDLGKLSEEINEYLTSLYQSANAFVDLINQLKDIDRDIVVVMVGDHAPSFLKELELDNKNDLENPMTPFVIWSNFDLDTSVYTDYANIYSLVPMILKMSNMPLTSYYQLNLEVHEKFPVITRGSLCLDQEENLTSYDTSNEEYELLTQYYYYEYNDIKEGRDYQEDLFILE